MDADIVISANFSDASSPILAGATEESLQATALVVSDVRSRPLNAVKALAGESQVALVISRVKDHRHGWTCTRTYYRRIRRAP